MLEIILDNKTKKIIILMSIGSKRKKGY